MRRKKINTATDLKILEDLGLGIPNKHIAQRYNVSPSYVSKIKMGRKRIDFSTVAITSTMQDVLAYIDTRITSLTQELNILNHIKNIIKGE